MKYAQLRKYDIANGVGVRTTLFVSGCHFKCQGCFNKEYQDFQYGNELTDNVIDTIIQYVSEPVVSGFSLLGGEPFDQPPEEIVRLLKTIKRTTGKSIWVWSGYCYETLLRTAPEALKLIDVLVDGQFELGQRDLRIEWRGSRNQRVIDVAKSLKNNSIILWEKR